MIELLIKKSQGHAKLLTKVKYNRCFMQMLMLSYPNRRLQDLEQVGGNLLKPHRQSQLQVQGCLA